MSDSRLRQAQDFFENGSIQTLLRSFVIIALRIVTLEYVWSAGVEKPGQPAISRDGINRFHTDYPYGSYNSP